MNERSEEFLSRARDPRMWRLEAQRLRCAARLLATALERSLDTLAATGALPEDDEGFPVLCASRSFWLLAGVDLENLLKSIIILKEPKRVTSSGLGNALKAHDLLRLARRAGFELDPIEGLYLSLGRERATWSGRFHASMKLAPSSSPAFSAADRMACDRLYDRFDDELAKAGVLSIHYEQVCNVAVTRSHGRSKIAGMRDLAQPRRRIPLVSDAVQPV